MVEIASLDPSEAPRARRWDALVLGSGISALVAAARISGAGQRVLVVEEEARTRLPPAVKEPFFLAGLRDQGLLDATLRALSVPLIDRRRIAAERLAYQLAADPYRVEIGQPASTADELVGWGLAKPDAAQTLIRRLVEASEIEREMLYDARFVRVGRRAPGARNPSGVTSGADPDKLLARRHKRGLPGEASEVAEPLGRMLAAQVRALSNGATRPPSPEAQARLLGLGLAGGVGFSDEPPWLIDLLRKRVTALYGDMRTLTGDFELVSVSGQPGVRMLRTGEMWLGRALVLAAPLSALRDRIGRDPARPAPDLLDRPVTRAYRATFLYRVPTRYLPEGMAARLILPSEGETQPTLAITAYPCLTDPSHVDLVARAVLPDIEEHELARERERLGVAIGERLRTLMPFSGDALFGLDVDLPEWDSDDGWLEDAPTGAGWPGEIDLRLSGRPPIYHLDRAAAAGLGLEGDLLLGWRGGDAIASELA